MSGKSLKIYEYKHNGEKYGVFYVVDKYGQSVVIDSASKFSVVDDPIFYKFLSKDSIDALNMLRKRQQRIVITNSLIRMYDSGFCKLDVNTFSVTLSSYIIEEVGKRRTFDGSGKTRANTNMSSDGDEFCLCNSEVGFEKCLVIRDISNGGRFIACIGDTVSFKVSGRKRSGRIIRFDNYSLVLDDNSSYPVTRISSIKLK